jgi:hypothetical protein
VGGGWNYSNLQIFGTKTPTMITLAELALDSISHLCSIADSGVFAANKANVNAP